MQESFLHYLWRTGRLSVNSLKSTQREDIQIIDSGEYNTNAGPDFLNARVRIGKTLWAGHIEMHLLSSDWMKHKHSSDPAYENVVLHVVLKEDLPIVRADGSRIQCVEVKEMLPVGLLSRYRQLMQNLDWVACKPLVSSVPEISVIPWLDRLLLERLQSKSEMIAELKTTNNGNWEETCYQLVARYLGGRVNAIPMQELAARIPQLLLAKHRDQIMQLEALLFGQAGMLQAKATDDYQAMLKKEYKFLQKKYKLKPMEATNWKFSRMRPVGFPTLRIAQLAKLIQQSVSLSDKFIHCQSIDTMKRLLSVEVGGYWLQHYRFGKLSDEVSQKSVGEDAIQSIIINAVLPMTYHYGQTMSDTALQQRAIDLLQSLPAEKNRLIRSWEEAGIDAKDAGQTQALLYLKKNYCDQKRCLECAIGNKLMLQGELAYLKEQLKIYNAQDAA